LAIADFGLFAASMSAMSSHSCGVGCQRLGIWVHSAARPGGGGAGHECLIIHRAELLPAPGLCFGKRQDRPI
jgi:hypothetical protein